MTLDERIAFARRLIQAGTTVEGIRTIALAANDSVAKNIIQMSSSAHGERTVVLNALATLHMFQVSGALRDLQTVVDTVLSYNAESSG